MPVVLHAQQKPSELIDIIDDVEEISYVEKLESNHFAEKYLMYVQQEVDWASKSAGKFNERIIVCFRGFDRPTVIVTEGYFAHYALFPSYEDELSRLFNTNIIVCEYRYFGESVPKECNWDYLTVDNSLADIHHVREIFGNIFPGKWISTGISKGGQTTMFYRATYPDDMDISVSYVAPLNKAVEDGRHEPFLSKQVGTKQEREAILNAQQELLSRKNTLIELFKDHTRKARLKFQLPTEDIYDYCVFEFPFALWQWGTSVNSIPPKSATDREWFDYFIKISDPVMTFDHIMEEIEIAKYLKNTTYTVGRKGYNSVNMLKTILFGFMDKGYISLRELEDECNVNIRYMYLMDYEAPSYKTFGNFINESLCDSVEEIFKEIMAYIVQKDNVDLNHLYIDGSKFEANANKYTWVWISIYCVCIYHTVLYIS